MIRINRKGAEVAKDRRENTEEYREASEGVHFVCRVQRIFLITFGVGILFYLSFAGVALAILALHFGNLPTANERWMVAGFLAVLAILSLLVSRAAKSRITALK